MEGSKIKRIHYLDSIRGIAAVLVLIYHVICSHWDWTTYGKLSKIIFNGTGAVAMFFVLSGLVLSLKLLDTDQDISYKFMNEFAIKRILRLYPAFLFSLIFYVFLQYNSTNISEIIEEALLIRDRNTFFTPDWTLGVEMALSLFVPFMVIIIRKSEKLFIWFLFMTLFIGTSYISKFVFLFGLGILISNRFEQIQNFKTQNHWLFKYKNQFIPFIVILFSFRHITHIAPIPESINYFLMKILSLNIYTFSGFGSFLILIFVINSKRVQKILSINILVFIGKISYGIYLSHWFFTKLVMNNFDLVLMDYSNNNKTIFFIVYLVFTLIGSILSGWFINKFIEVPVIRLTKKIFSKKIRRPS